LSIKGLPIRGYPAMFNINMETNPNFGTQM
jgi:hypothetical protein